MADVGEGVKECRSCSGNEGVHEEPHNEAELVNLEIRSERAHERYLYQSCSPCQTFSPKERPGTNCLCVCEIFHDLSNTIR